MFELKLYGFSLLLIYLIGAVGATAHLHPIILVPGDGGSQIEAKINKPNVVHYICSKNSDWFSLWLNVELMVPEVIDCWADNMKLTYNNATRKTSNNFGVQTRVPGFGNTSTVEYLDQSQRGFSMYFGNIVKFLEPLGYKRGINIHGAPYDFRKAANELGVYLSNTKKLIETTYAQNGNTRVIIIGHSMGCPMMLYFLNQQSQSWKDKYIQSFITIAGVWGGTVRAMKVFAVGDNLGQWIVSQKSLMIEQRTSPSLAWLMPSDEFWRPDEILVQTDKKNFTHKDFQEFFNDLGEPNGFEMFKDTRNLNKGLKAPNVEVFCLHGSGVPTTRTLVYPPTYWPNGLPVLRKGDGDGTVNLRSLMGCTRWSGQQTQKVHHHVFNATNHLEILRNDPPSKYIASIISKLNRQNRARNNPIIEIIP